MASVRPGWRPIKFAQIADYVNERVDDPSKAGVARYVGLEHLDPESLTIRRWGTPKDVESTKLRFRPGDIIFGKRRAYQRKLAVAPFEGICSAHAMVLRARPDAVVPEFLPFFMQSDGFMERAQAISVGSLSPTINWKTLAAQEFVLPPLAKQVLWAREFAAVERALADAQSATEKGEEFLEVQTWNLVTGKRAAGPRVSTSAWTHGRLPGIATIPAGWRLTPLTKVSRLESGHTPSRRHPEYWAGSIPWISLADIQRLHNPSITSTEGTIGPLGVENSSARLLPAGTVVLSRTAMIGFTSVMARPMTTSQDFANFVCSDEIRPGFLHCLFSSMKEFLDYTAVGSSNVKTIYLPFFQKLEIALPPIGHQDEIVAQVVDTREHLERLRTRAQEHAALLLRLREARLGESA
jgi:type I restriction enzyme, S subunit